MLKTLTLSHMAANVNAAAQEPLSALGVHSYSIEVSVDYLVFECIDFIFVWIIIEYVSPIRKILHQEDNAVTKWKQNGKHKIQRNKSNYYPNKYTKNTKFLRHCLLAPTKCIESI